MGKLSDFDNELDDNHATFNPASGIKVLDRSLLILRTATAQPMNLSEICSSTGLPRATAHRLLTALHVHRLLERDKDGRWSAGPGLSELSPASSDRIIQAGMTVMRSLMEKTNESVQIYRLTGNVRTCIASIEPASGLQNTVPVGARMSLLRGSAARVLMAWAPEELVQSIIPDAAFTEDDLAEIRTTGVAESIGERDPSLASVSTPIRANQGVVAALSISGPVERLRPSPQQLYGNLIREAAKRINQSLQ